MKYSKNHIEEIRYLFINLSYSYAKIVTHFQEKGIQHTRSSIAGLCNKYGIKRSCSNPMPEPWQTSKPKAKAKILKNIVPVKRVKFTDSENEALPRAGGCKFPYGNSLPFKWCNADIYKRNYCEEHYNQCHSGPQKANEYRNDGFILGGWKKRKSASPQN